MFSAFADDAIAGRPLPREAALALLRTPDHQLLDLVAAAGRVRRRFFANLVKVNYLINLKSGLCPEDCGYCSQRLGSTTDILKYSWLKPDEVVGQAGAGIGGGASRVCLVASGRGPSHRDIGRVAGFTERLKEAHPGVEVCACLGFLKDGQADALRKAGVDAYNHNLNTAESRYEDICSTHTYADRADTVARARDAGLSPCSGLIVGMGETDEQLVEAVEALREIGSDSIPVNFLIPFEGTPLGHIRDLDPRRSLRILAVVRLMCPDRELRMAGGREMHLRTLQPLALHVVNSLFLGDYLTSEGQAARADIEMIVDGGFEILGQDAQALLAALPDGPEPGVGAEPGTDPVHGPGTAAEAPLSADIPAPAGAAGSPCCGAGGDHGAGAAARPTTSGRIELPAIRRRGAGTSAAPNA
ncbi:biotin synthase BioB [Brevibacterium sp. 5221]|uniref:Biotin synthase n=1 Tax=Brevibacterium rongguiense TaxID=2695267 RepID=A0A6N9H4E3_9MICO|nr:MULTISPECIES: biotin synthase BioB [Brevibacterium]MYM18805.1 biotin synthase BioB [Brevibacterium rongguiense]WAL39877.1 biotin synthase BioB [Brevibacterium sp. BRM-1]